MREILFWEGDGSMVAETLVGGGLAAQRYARQVVLQEIGEEGQRKLAQSTLMIVGCGALGSTQAELLVRAGVGKGALRRLRKINSQVEVEAFVEDVTPANVEKLLASADLLMDGTDNFETRYLLNDAAVATHTPWIYGGVLGTSGTVMAILPDSSPCLRCVFPEPPKAFNLPTCESHGVLNAAVSWVAALQVTEAFKVLLGYPAEEFKLYALNIWEGMLTPVKAEKGEKCPCCGEKRFDFLHSRRGSSSTIFCGRNAVQITPEQGTAIPDFTQLSRRLASHGSVTVNGLILEFLCGSHRLVIFPDGRVLVVGTTDVAEARSLMAKYMGI
jgi:adenylyltransferase/sulfurtransferase